MTFLNNSKVRKHNKEQRKKRGKEISTHPYCFNRDGDLIKNNENHTDGSGCNKIEKKGNTVPGFLAVACHNVPAAGPDGLILLETKKRGKDDG